MRRVRRVDPRELLGHRAGELLGERAASRARGHRPSPTRRRPRSGSRPTRRRPSSRRRPRPAAPSSCSTSCADAPCGAAESTSQCGAVRSRSIAASIETNSSSGYAGARCANVFATGSPAWLDDTTRAEREARVRVDQAQELAGNVARTHRARSRGKSAPRRSSGRLREPATEADARLEQVAELGRVRHRVDRGDVRAVSDDVDADLVVGRGSGDHGRLDAELLAQAASRRPRRRPGRSRRARAR